MIAVLQGGLTFADGYWLVIKERLSCDTGVVVIESYGYELWHNAEKLAWYDSQPHLNDATLASTHPHHKHIPPNIKRNRILAPQMSFTRPNLQKTGKKAPAFMRGDDFDRLNPAELPI